MSNDYIISWAKMMKAVRRNGLVIVFWLWPANSTTTWCAAVLSLFGTPINLQFADGLVSLNIKFSCPTCLIFAYMNVFEQHKRAAIEIKS